MIADSINHGVEVIGLAKHAALDGLEDLGQVRVDCVLSIGMAVPQILNIFGQCAEEEDILLADLASDLNLSRSKQMENLSSSDWKLTLAPSHVPIIKPPFNTNFMLLVPEALNNVSIRH